MEKMSLKRRDFLRWSAMAGAGGLLAACTPKIVEVEKQVTRVVEKVVKETVIVEGTPQVVEKVVKQTVVVEKVIQPTARPTLAVVPLMFSDWPDEWAVAVHTELINEFQEAHPNTSVSYFPQIGYDLSKLTAMMAGGVAPDVFGGWGDWMRTWAEKGQLLNLDENIKAHGQDMGFDDMYQAQFEAMQYQGSQYALPKYVNPNTLYYNRTMFDEAGVDYPTYDWTWEDWREVAGKLTKREGADTTQWGLYIPMSSRFSRDTGFVWGNCGEFVDKNDNTKFTFDSPEAIEGLQVLHDFIWKDKVQALESDVGGISTPFVPGLVAMALDGGNNWKLWNDQIGDRFQWDGTMLPKSKCGRGIRVSTDGFMVYSGTRYPELAWDLFALMLSGKAAKMRLDQGGLPPPRRSIMLDFAQILPQFNLKCVADAMEEARADPRSVWAGGNATWNVIKPHYDECFILNKVSVEEAMKAAVADLHAQKPWLS